MRGYIGLQGREGEEGGVKEGDGCILSSFKVTHNLMGGVRGLLEMVEGEGGAVVAKGSMTEGEMWGVMAREGAVPMSTFSCSLTSTKIPVKKCPTSQNFTDRFQIFFPFENRSESRPSIFSGFLKMKDHENTGANNTQRPLYA